MKKSVLVIDILIFLLVMGITFSQNDKVDNEIEELLKEQDEVSVIVILEDDYDFLEEYSDYELMEMDKHDKKKMMISEQQDRVMLGLNYKKNEMGIQFLKNKSSNNEIVDFKLKRKFTSINGFVGNLTKEGLEKLKNDNKVKKIDLNYPTSILLSDTIDIVKATDTWRINYNNSNITGKGETICVIDTGVDYRHPDLGGRTSLEIFFDDYDNLSNIGENNNISIVNGEVKLESNNTVNGNFTSVGVNVTNPIIKVKPTWNANGSINVKISINGGVDWNIVSNNTEISFDYNSVNTNLTYFVEITDSSIALFDLTIDYTLSLPSFGLDYKVIGGYDIINEDDDPIDDNGHGTNVAGIIAANGSIVGIAPDAKIVAIKVLGSGGLGNQDDVISGMEWCINNASKFNISVISMSLGCTTNKYATHCDALPSCNNE